MSTSPSTSTAAPSARDRETLRLVLHDDAASYVQGAWWPRSRDLAVEAADLVDHFPPEIGHIDRLLFSRPDWEGPATGGRRIGHVVTQRGRVKLGSFPSDDTQLMILTMASGSRLRLLVVPGDTEAEEGERRMREIAEHGVPDGDDADWARWDDEFPE